MKNYFKLFSILMFVTITQQSLSMQRLRAALASPLLSRLANSNIRLAAQRASTTLRPNIGISRLPIVRGLAIKAAPKPQFNYWKRGLGLAGAAGLMGLGVAMWGQKAKAEKFTGYETTTIKTAHGSLTYKKPKSHSCWHCPLEDLTLNENITPYCDRVAAVRKLLRKAVDDSENRCPAFGAHLEVTKNDDARKFTLFKQIGASITKNGGDRSEYFADFEKEFIHSNDVPVVPDVKLVVSYDEKTKKPNKIEAFKHARAVGELSFDCFDSNDQCWISRLHVDSQYRGQGIGKALLQEAAHLSRKGGCKKLCGAPASSTREFYKKCGAKETVDGRLCSDLSQ